MILELDVLLERLRIAELVDHDAVVDDQVNGDERVDLLRVSAELGHRIAHCGEVHHRGNAGEVLHQHPRGAILDLASDLPLLLPVDHCLEVIASDRYAVLEAQEVLEQHLHREGQTGDVAERLGSLGNREIGIALARGLEARARAEAVLAGRNHSCPSLCSGMGKYACKFGSVSALSNHAADPQTDRDLAPNGTKLAPR